MAQTIHGARGHLAFANSNVVMDVSRWSLRTERRTTEMTQLQNYQFSIPQNKRMFAERFPLKAAWSVEFESFFNDADVPRVNAYAYLDVHNTPPVEVTLTDGSGLRYIGNGHVVRWDPDNDRFALNRLSGVIVGTGPLKVQP